MNNADFFLRNKGMEKKQKVKTDRVHKNSMEEWELRLNGKKIKKQWKSAVDRIIEKSESKHRNIEFTDEKSCYDEPMKFQTNNRQRHEETRTSTEKNSRRSERLSHIEKLKLKRPKSLDRGNNFGNIALGFAKKYHYYSREDILAADDEQSDDADREVATITGSFGRETRSYPIKSTPKDQPPEERLKGSQSSLPSYNEATSGKFNLTTNNSNEEVESGRKKKRIIPVQSDFESSSPSPDPLQTPPSSQSPVPVIRASVRTSQSSFNLAARAQEPEADRTKKSLGMKLKTSYSSLLDLRKYGLGNNGSGFRDHSDLMGRVTPKSEVCTPVMARSRLPHDVLAQYNGKTREDLIEMVVDLKKELDGQGKKIVDLEDYIDNLLIKILDVAPILLKQDSPIMSKHHIM